MLAVRKDGQIQKPNCIGIFAVLRKKSEYRRSTAKDRYACKNTSEVLSVALVSLIVCLLLFC